MLATVALKMSAGAPSWAHREQAAEELLGRLSACSVGAEDDAQLLVRILSVSDAGAVQRLHRERDGVLTGGIHAAQFEERNPARGLEIRDRRGTVRAASAGVEGGHRRHRLAAGEQRIAEGLRRSSERRNDAEARDDDPGGHARVRYHCR